MTSNKSIGLENVKVGDKVISYPHGLGTIVCDDGSDTPHRFGWRKRLILSLLYVKMNTQSRSVFKKAKRKWAMHMKHGWCTNE